MQFLTGYGLSDARQFPGFVFKYYPVMFVGDSHYDCFLSLMLGSYTIGMFMVATPCISYFSSGSLMLCLKFGVLFLDCNPFELSCVTVNYTHLTTLSLYCTHMGVLFFRLWDLP